MATFLWPRFYGHVSCICFGIGAYEEKCRKRGNKNVAIVHTLELNLARLAVGLSMLAWGKDRTWCVVNILVAV